MFIDPGMPVFRAVLRHRRRYSGHWVSLRLTGVRGRSRLEHRERAGQIFRITVRMRLNSHFNVARACLDFIDGALPNQKKCIGKLVVTELTAPQAPSSRRRIAADAQRRLAATGSNRATGRFDRVAFGLALAATLVLLGWVAAYEADTSSLQSLFISRAVKDMTFTVEPGPSAAIRFPEAGPYDRRLGYAQLPSFIDRLSARHFVVERQARQSPLLGRFIDAGGYAVYHEKAQAGLVLRDRTGTPLETARYPSAAYPGFAAVPPLVAHTLRFIEDRDLLDPRRPNRNPAVEWRRLGVAALGRAGKYIDPSLGGGGGSTLATQIEKFRHSPGGRTEGLVEKLRQMSTATARTYLDGPKTLAAQQLILTTYLNSTPLGSRPGYGEVIGLGDGLLAWYGTDFAEANRALAARPPAGVALERRGEIYKQALSLLIAQRRPSYYLNAGRGALQSLTNSYLRRLGAAGVIGPVLRDAALKADLRFRSAPPSPPACWRASRTATPSSRSAWSATSCWAARIRRRSRTASSSTSAAPTAITFACMPTASTSPSTSMPARSGSLARRRSCARWRPISVSSPNCIATW